MNIKQLLVGILFTLLFQQLIFSQNYNIAASGRVYNYQKQQLFMAVRVDSTVLINSDTLFYHFEMQRDTVPYWAYGSCIDLFGGSLFGKRHLYTSDSILKIITFKNDSVIIKPYAPIDTHWILYQWPNGNYIDAYISDIYQDTIFGLVDEVKNIKFSVKNTLGDILTSNFFNMKEICISMSNGLLTSYDFYLFPTDTVLCNLTGISNPDLGHIPGYKDFFEFNPGDLFHTIQKDLYYIHNGTNYIIHSGFINKTIKEVLDVIVFNDDSATYLFDVCSHVLEYNNNVADTTYNRDTIVQTYHFNPLPDSTFLMLPFQTFLPQINWYDMPIVYRYQQDRIYHEYNVYNYIAINDSCWAYLIADPAPQYFRYIEGCGGPYTYFADWMGAVTEYTLVYYQKGSEVWGNPLAPNCQTLSGISSNVNNIQNDVQIFPNPASSDIKVIAKNIDKIDIINISGQLVKSIKFSGNENEANLSLSFLEKGFYFVWVYSTDYDCIKKLILN
ncbi:MAG: T9SS type A sorting domain-containing protein [Bacteroidales bacterium]|nr:T9SS type A sorting domain-containing protein [Bacteroidales bacterium]